MNTYPVCDCLLFRDRRVAALLFRAELTLLCVNRSPILYAFFLCLHKSSPV